MRVPLSWLAEYVELPAGTNVDDVHAALVRVGLEEEDLHDFALQGPIVVGQVLDFEEEPQKNGKTIRWCRVQVAPEGETAADGGDAVHGIVCGASNFFAGDKVVVSLPGAVLPGPFPIAARKTYGHVSDGMIASARELGLGDEHDGILRLTELGLDPEVGTDAIALLGLDDAAVEINVTPDRGYAFSIRGVAREYAHSTGAAFRDPVLQSSTETGSGFSVTIDDRAPLRGASAAPVFVTRVVRDIDPHRPTPPWMLARLQLAGMRSISIAVDITNYVMLEFGQPIHGYDLDHLAGGLTVRRAEPGESLTTLDGTTRTLHGEDIVIADESGAIGVAGVMGGSSTELGPDTRNVLIEAAVFDAISIARSARRHKLPSEASKRFERGVDPTMQAAAANRVAELLVELAGGTLDSRGSVHDEKPAATTILLPDGFAARLVGVDYTDAEIDDTLQMIGATIERLDVARRVTAPPWRVDMHGPEDLVEEIARIVGYDRIPSILPVAPPGRGLTPAQSARRRVKDGLAAAGFTEVLAYPFVSSEQNALYGSSDGRAVPAVRLLNALDQTAPEMRTSLLPGLVATAQRNYSRGLTDLAIFEEGLVFLPEEGAEYGTPVLPPAAERPDAETLAALYASTPPQPRHLAVVILGARVVAQPGQTAEAASLVDALDAARHTARSLGLDLEVVAVPRASLHPGRSAQLRVNGTVVGYAGELHPEVTAAAHLPRVVAVAEMDLDALIQAGPPFPTAAAFSTYPAATQDLSLVVDAAAPATDVLAAVRAGAGALLEEIRLVADYRGAGLDAGTKSLTFALRFRADDRTLTAAEASEAKLAGSARAAELFGAGIRS